MHTRIQGGGGQGYSAPPYSVFKSPPLETEEHRMNSLSHIFQVLSGNSFVIKSFELKKITWK